jgi:hypothetical protein
MTTITENPRRQYESAGDAERDIEVFFPAGWFYEIVPIHMATGGTTIANDRFAIKVYGPGDDGNGGPLLGYACREEEE